MWAMLIAFCTVFVSCKEKKDAPTIKFTYNGVVQNNGAEVNAKIGEEIPIIVEYEALGRIDHIFLRVDSTAHNEARASFKKETTYKITKTIKFDYSMDTQIRVFVQDKQKDPLSANFELKVKVR
jgi:ABC-type uncharacterized transport system auxiliary subunit